ncbi:MAG: sigma-54-dependent Fis family transcriptional regulator [Proteobacteria bacterium]|nr:sigma-54-dependent Fis family transcriptional regulator [Pseudomonadota bacterium]
MAYNVLIVDDEADIRFSMGGLLEDEGFNVTTAEGGQQALNIIAEEVPDIVLLDIWMDGMDGLEALRKIKRKHSNLPVVMISGHGTVETAVQATQKGAYDFIEKPPQADRLILTIDRAIRDSKLIEENLLLRTKSGRVQELLGSSSEIASVRHMIKQVAKGDSRVMITGDSGAGKEVVARLIHRYSLRSEESFFVLNPAAISENTFELTLYSILENASKGTLYLDEVGDLSLNMQGKLLKFLQEGIVENPETGARKEVNLRIIASTSFDLKDLISKKEFRADLFYRLNVVPIEVPPLRDRTVDIPPLVNNFLSLLSTDKENQTTLTPAAMAILTSYSWPGNVRQLKNLIEWLIIMYPAKNIDSDMLPSDLTKTDQAACEITDLHAVRALSLRDAREIFEKSYLGDQLKRFNGNISRTADFVGMERSALHRKLKMLGVIMKD